MMPYKVGERVKLVGAVNHPAQGTIIYILPSGQIPSREDVANHFQMRQEHPAYQWAFTPCSFDRIGFRKDNGSGKNIIATVNVIERLYCE